eukprot:CAMPEP_0183394732 /NCGR_PEP_ID=MMETSP0370-20130417/8802_1 /TAXON_ID=268820 /ORGANISM="Peridinium aciculiferum, Strain PAER-2" /LENGTH=74 /DNA_ID=CAMNT_0025575197 /DNA_START=88 /DNA_END=312 /DNA_ORIENTATION=-
MPTAGKRPVRGQEMTEQRAADKKAAGKPKGDTRKGTFKCSVCMSPMTNYSNLKQHYESKHPKETCPTEESCNVA